MISLAVAVGLWLGANPLVEPALDRAICDPRPSLPAGAANAPTIEGLLRLDEPRIQECMLRAQLDGDEATDVTVRVRGGARARFEVTGKLGARARNCLSQELNALLPSSAVAPGTNAEVHFRRSPLTFGGAHDKDCATPSRARGKECQAEASAIDLAQHLRWWEPKWCGCFTKLPSMPAAVAVEFNLRNGARKERKASVKSAPGDAAGECLAHAIEPQRLERFGGGDFDLPLVFTVIDSRASAVGEQAPADLKRDQTTAIVEHAQSDVLFALGRRQEAFERFDSGVQHYAAPRDRPSVQDAAARVQQNAKALSPIHTDCLALVKADEELRASVDAALTWLRKGVELAKATGEKPDAWQRGVTHQTAYRASIEQERTKHSAGCEEIARAARDGLAITWHKPPPPAANPSSDEPGEEAAQDAQGQR